MLVLTPSGSPHFDQSIPVQNLTGPPAQGSKKENLAIFAETSNKTFIISQQYFKKYPLLNQLNLSPSRRVWMEDDIYESGKLLEVCYDN